MLRAKLYETSRNGANYLDFLVQIIRVVLQPGLPLKPPQNGRVFTFLSMAQ